MSQKKKIYNGKCKQSQEKRKKKQAAENILFTFKGSVLLYMCSMG